MYGTATTEPDFNPMKLNLIPALSLLAPLCAPAALVTFRYDTRINAAAAGGGTDMPLSILYTFDSAWPDDYNPDDPEDPDTGEISPRESTFGPVSVQVTLGSETVTTTGGVLGLVNDGFGAVGPQMDLYCLTGSGLEFSGSLLGMKPEGFWLSFYDVDSTMFSGGAKPELPLTPDFSTAADESQVFLHFTGPVRSIGGPVTSGFDFTVVPEPASCT
ncbi:MAG: hypothetical protein EOP45_08475, partial [Sphingobacteriaceae bacterium]